MRFVGFLLTVDVGLLVGMFVGMPVERLFLLPLHRNTHPGAGDAAAGDLFRGVHHAGNSQTIELLYKGLRLGKQLQQRRCEHISCRSHIALKENRFHLVVLLPAVAGSIFLIYLIISVIHFKINHYFRSFPPSPPKTQLLHSRGRST